MHITLTTDELIERLKEHPGMKVTIDHPDCCLVVSDQIQVQTATHVKHGTVLVLGALFSVHPKANVIP